MKKTLFTLFKILIALVLFGKVLGFILNFNTEIKDILNIAMFSLIGIAYIVMGFVWDNKLYKIIFITCGIFLIIMNVFKNIVVLDIMAIVCILTPMLLTYFNKEKERKISVS